MPAPPHEGVLTLIWLGRFLVDDFMDARSAYLPMVHGLQDTIMRNNIVKTAIATRLKVSLGKKTVLIRLQVSESCLLRSIQLDISTKFDQESTSAQSGMGTI